MRTIVRIDKYRFRQGGKIEYRDTVQDIKIIGGKKYVHEEDSIKTYDFDQDWEKSGDKNFSKYEINAFDFLGIPEIVFYETKIFYRGIETPQTYSENKYINLLLWLADPKNGHKGIIPSGINLFVDKSNNAYGDRLKDLANGSKIVIELSSYGFNNSLFIRVPLAQFIKCDRSKLRDWQIIDLKRRYPRIFPDFFYERNLTESEEYNLAVNLLKFKINNKTKNKNYATS